MSETWGVLAGPPADWTTFQRWRIIRAYRRHRETVVDRQHIAWARKLASEVPPAGVIR